MKIRLNSLRTKLTGAHLIGVAMLIGVTLLSLSSIDRIVAESDRLQSVNKALIAIDDLERVMSEAEAELDRYQVNGDTADHTVFVRKSLEAVTMLDSMTTVDYLSDAQVSVVRQAQTRWASGRDQGVDVRALVDPTTREGREMTLKAIGNLQKAEDAIKLIEDEVKLIADEAAATTDSTQTSIYGLLRIIGVISVVLGISASLFLHQRIGVPIAQLASTVRRIGDGELDVTVGAKSKDEIRDLAVAINDMTAQLNTSKEQAQSYNNTLEQRVIERTRELTALNMMSSIASSSLDLDHIVQDTFRKVLDLMGFEGGMVHIVEQSGDETGPSVLTLKASSQLMKGLSDEYATISDPAFLPMRALRAGTPQLITRNDPEQEIDVMSDVFLSTHPSLKSIISVPMQAKKTTLGTMTLFSSTKVTVSPNDIALLTSIGHQIGVSVENARLYEDARNYAETIAALGEIDRAILSTLDIDEVITQVISNLGRVVSYDAAVIAVIDKDGKAAKISAMDAEGKTFVDQQMTPLDQTLIDQIINDPEPASRFNLSATETLPPFEASLLEKGVVSYLAVPLDIRGEAMGVIAIGANKASQFSKRDLEMTVDVANQASIALDNARLYESEKEHYLSSIRALAAAVDARDPYTAGHSERVAEYAVRIAKVVGMSNEDIETVRFAGLLHDIGKIGIADEILKKPGPLDAAERAIMISHSTISQAILKQVESFENIALPVRHHHEWYGGGGYPDALQGDEIPILARILSVADAFEAMTSTRPYRLALSIDAAKRSLLNGESIQFDPGFVTAMMTVLEQEEAENTELWTALRSRTEHPEDAGFIGIPEPQEAEDRVGVILPGAGQSLNVIYTLTQELRTIQDMDFLLKRCVEVLSKEHGKGRYSILLTDTTTDDLEVVATSEMPDQIVGTRLPSGDGITGWAVHHGEPVMVHDVTEDTRFISEHPELPTLSELAVPLITDGRTIGVLDVSNERRAAFTLEDIRLMVTVATEIASSIEVGRLHTRLREASMYDDLTHVFNQNYFKERLDNELVRSRRYKRPLSIAVVDVIGVADINETGGRQAGDSALIGTSDFLRHSIRACDVLARYSGDAFAIIMPETGAIEAESLMCRLLDTMGRTTHHYAGEDVLLPQCAHGIAVYPTHGVASEELFSAADEMMRRDKKTKKALGKEKSGDSSGFNVPDQSPLSNESTTKGD